MVSRSRYKHAHTSEVSYVNWNACNVMYLYFVIVLLCLHLFQSFLVFLKFVFKFLHILHKFFFCWWQNRLLLIHQAQNMFSPDTNTHNKICSQLVTLHFYTFFAQCRKQTRQAMYRQRNVLVHSRNVYTSSTTLRAWYHFTQRQFSFASNNKIYVRLHVKCLIFLPDCNQI